MIPINNLKPIRMPKSVVQNAQIAFFVSQDKLQLSLTLCTITTGPGVFIPQSKNIEPHSFCGGAEQFFLFMDHVKIQPIETYGSAHISTPVLLILGIYKMFSIRLGLRKTFSIRLILRKTSSIRLILRKTFKTFSIRLILRKTFNIRLILRKTFNIRLILRKTFSIRLVLIKSFSIRLILRKHRALG